MNKALIGLCVVLYLALVGSTIGNYYRIQKDEQVITESAPANNFIRMELSSGAHISNSYGFYLAPGNIPTHFPDGDCYGYATSSSADRTCLVFIAK